MSFDSLGLSQSILKAVVAQGYVTPTPIQQLAIPHVLSTKDVLGCAQTGTGKTAAFALPILDLLSRSKSPESRSPDNDRRSGHAGHGNASRRMIRALVLAPTRELAAQIGDSFRVYGEFSGLRSTVIYGGVGQGPQVRAIQQGVDTLVATPGRLLDLMQQGFVQLRDIGILVLDEADQMLDMGFLPSLKQIVAKVPARRQTLLFSATMPPEIRQLAQSWLRQPIEVKVAPAGTAADRVQQSVYHVTPQGKLSMLAHVLRSDGCNRTLVFTRTKHGADKVVRKLELQGIQAAAIHGNKSQNQRQKVLDQFRAERLAVLVATDIAARGLDIDGVSHVINFDLPTTPEQYVHRIGRTGRAGASGIAVSLCGPEERDMVRQIERLTRLAIAVVPCPPEVARQAANIPAAGSGTPAHVGSQRANGNRRGGEPNRGFGPPRRSKSAARPNLAGGGGTRRPRRERRQFAR